MFRIPYLFVLMAALLTSCAPGGEPVKRDGVLHITTTTAQVADLVNNIGQEYVKVISLMGEGVDPHLFKASQGDIAKLAGADLIFYNGLMLEGRMGDVLEKMAQMGRPTRPVSDGLDPSRLTTPKEFGGHHDPHIWMDVGMWAETIPIVVDELSKQDSSHHDVFVQNGKAYQEKLMALHEESRQKIATIPETRRIMVTAHDAFGYFGRAYGIEVRGLQGISTASEFGLQDLQRLVDLIVERRVKAVFVETSVPRRSIESLMAGCQAKGHEVKIGGLLYSDAMGASGTEEGTYLGMMRHNVDTIVAALR